MQVKKLETYTKETATRIRELLIQLSRSGKDKGEISEQWFKDVITSPWHDLLYIEENDKILGIACVSVIMGAGIRKNAYLEDFVTDSTIRGKGIGSALWQAIINWAKEKDCQNLEFTCGQGREASQKFYQNRGAEIYDTNFFRYKL